MPEETVICTFRVKGAEEKSFCDLLGGHWQKLHDLGLVTDEESVIYRSQGEPATYVEIFTWADGAAERAHDIAEVQEIWSAMGPLLEERDGRPKWEFPHFHQASLR
jgi:hypothetical protein